MHRTMTIVATSPLSPIAAWWLVVCLAGLTGLGHAAETSSKLKAADSGSFEDLLFFSRRPVFIRFHLHVDGQPWQSTRQALVKAQFRRLDRDRDGFITPDMLTGIPLPGFNPTDITPWDTSPQDGKFSLAEFAQLFEVAGQPSFLLAEGVNRPTRMVKLFPHLDTNQDRRLTQGELMQARATLTKLDYDEDETVSTTELAPFRNPLIQAAALTSEKPLSSDAPFVSVNTLASPAELAKLMMQRYGRRPNVEAEDNRSANPSECWLEDLGGAVADAAQHDLDANGRLTLAEMTAYVAKPVPDVEVRVELPCNKPGRPQLHLLNHRLTAGPAPGRPSSRVAVDVDQVGLDLRAQSSRLQSRDNRSFYLLQLRVADQNKNSYLEPDEFPRVGLDADFAAVDADADGQVVRDELIAYLDRDAFAAQIQVVLSVSADSRTLFEVLDVDYDQRLAMREFAQLPARVKPLDKNRDNILDASEMSQQYRMIFSLGKPRIFRQQMSTRPNGGIPAPRATPNRNAPEWFRKMDRNQDGDLSWREFLGKRTVFNQLDQNQDGLVTGEEVENLEDDQ